MELKDLIQSFISKFTKDIKGRKFDENLSSDLFNILYEEKPLDIKDDSSEFDYAFSKNINDNYYIDKEKRLDIIEGIYKNLEDDQKEDFINAMSKENLEKDISDYLNQEKKKMIGKSDDSSIIIDDDNDEKIIEFDEDNINYNGNEIDSIDEDNIDTNPNFDNSVEENVVDINKVLNFEQDGKEISKFKGKTEELEKELEELEKNNMGIDTIKDEIDLKIKENNAKFIELDSKYAELQRKNDLVDLVISRLSNKIKNIENGNSSIYEDDYGNNYQERIKANNEKIIDIDLDEMRNLVEIQEKANTFDEKFYSSNSMGEPVVPLIELNELKNSILNVKDETLKNDLITRVKKIETVTKKSFTIDKSTFDDIDKATSEIRTILKKYKEIIERKNLKIQRLNEQISKDISETFEQTAKIDRELLIATIGKGYHEYDLESINRMDNLVVESIVDRIIKDTLAKPSGKQQLMEFMNDYKNSNQHINEEIEKIKNEKNNIYKSNGPLFVRKEQLSNIIKIIDDFKGKEVLPEIVEIVKSKINKLDESKEIKEILNNRLNKVINNNEIIDNLDSKIESLKNEISKRKENENIYNSCLVDIKELDYAIKNGLDKDSEEAKEFISEIRKKCSLLPNNPEKLKEEVEEYLNMILGKKIVKVDKVEKNLKKTKRTYIAMAAGIGLGVWGGLTLTGAGAIIVPVVATLADLGLRKLEQEAKSRRLNGITVESIEEPSGKLKKAVHNLKEKALQHEDILRDLNWFLTAGLLSYSATQIYNNFLRPRINNNVIDPTNRLNDNIGTIETNTQPSIPKVGEHVNGLEYGYRNSLDAAANTNSVHLNQAILNDGKTVVAGYRVGGQTVTSLPNGVSPDAILLTDGTEKGYRAWAAVNDVVETVGRSLH